MKPLRNTLFALAVCSALAVPGSFLVQANFASKAQVYQLIKPTEEAALFGEVGEKIGSPQEYVVDDQNAVLPEPLPDGTLGLNDTYLKEKGIYPLQLKSVKETLGTARIGFGAAVLVFTLAGVIVGSRLKKSAS